MKAREGRRVTYCREVEKDINHKTSFSHSQKVTYDAFAEGGVLTDLTKDYICAV